MSAAPIGMSAKVDIDVVVTEMLSSVVGQELISWSWEAMAWSWYVICELVIAILGITGNALVIVVVFGRRSMNRSTDILVGNLAIADFVTSVFLIPHPTVNSIPNTWTGSLFCKVMEGEYVMWTAVTASIYSLVAVSFDRFFAVIYPIHFMRFATRRLVNRIVCLIWAGSCVFMVRIFWTNTTDVIVGKCVYQRQPRSLETVFGIYVFVVHFALPTVLMVVTQIAIARSLRREAARFVSNESTASFHQIARSRVLTLTLTVVLIYVICWAPDQIAFLSFNLGLTPSFVRSTLARVVIALAICNSCVNPIVYTLRHPQFREAVRHFFRNKSKRNTPIFEDLELQHRLEKSHLKHRQKSNLRLPHAIELSICQHANVGSAD
ncbi:allatostatin-A receptor-like [Diadema antillarum]|uniref:allatostatin-A receptor-like n=1 Tax=Diadema antillarum TaxID=105358 RepID=UPI003A85DC54